MIHALAYSCGRDSTPDKAKSAALLANPGCMAQALKADIVGNELVLEMLATQSLNAEANGSMLAKKVEIDFLLRASGTTQISDAIRRTGAKPGRRFILAVAGRRKLKAVPGPWEELPRKELSEEELDLIEKGALLSVLRA